MYVGGVAPRGFIHFPSHPRNDYFEQVAFDALLADGDAVNLNKPFRFDTIRQQLQGTYADPTSCREQIERGERACFEPGCNALTNDVAVRQQTLEVVRDIGASRRRTSVLHFHWR